MLLAMDASVVNLMLQTAAQWALQMAPLVVLPIVAWVGKQVASFLAAHVHNAKLQGILLRLESHAEAVVRSQFQMVVDDLKADAADGKITPEELEAELAKVKDEALASLKKLLSPEGLAKIEEVLGLDPNGIALLLNTVLESVLHKVKLQTAAVAAASGRPTKPS